MRTDRDTFKLIHCELIMEMQCIEHDLKLIYAYMHTGSVENNMKRVETMNLGAIIYELQELDNSDGNPDLSDDDYDLLHEIREFRNYWCHQCYIDYVYIQNDREREIAFQKVYSRLKNDEDHIYNLRKNVESFRLKEVERYDR